MFGHPARIGRARFAGDELTLHQTMMGYWTRFATTGDPNGGDAVPWPEYDRTAERDLEMNVAPVAGSHHSADACTFWEGLGVFP